MPRKWPIAITRVIASSGLILLQLITGRIFGAATLGGVSLVLGLALPASSVSRLGIDLLATRELGVAFHLGRKRYIGAYTYAGLYVSLTTALLLCGLVLFLSGLNPVEKQNQEGLHWIYWGLPLIPALAATYIVAAMLRSTNHPAVSQIFDIGGVAIVLTLLSAILFSVSGEWNNWVFPMTAAAITSIALFVTYILHKPPSFRRTLALSRKFFKLRATLARLLAIASIQFIVQWMPGPIIAAIWSLEDAGGFAVSQRISMTLYIILGVVGSTMAPRYAGLFKAGKLSEIIEIERKIRAKLRIFAITSLIIIVLTGNIIISIFGLIDSENNILISMIIMSIGQVINLSLGCSTHMLVPFSLESHLLKITTYSIALGSLAAVVCAPLIGLPSMAVGIAVSTAVPPLMANYRIMKMTVKDT